MGEDLEKGRQPGAVMSFWDHLDVLRSYLVRLLLVCLVFGILAFCFKDTLFRIVLAPGSDDFVTYRLFDWINHLTALHPMPSSFSVELINTGLAAQFMIHMKTAFGFGFFCAVPYALYLMFRFVSPALYAQEKKYAYRAIGAGYLMFLMGVLLGYFLIFPLTFRFLGTYQVADSVQNLISLQSYMGTFLMLNLLMGLVFEIPVLCWLFGKMGFISASFLKKYRKYAIVIILALAAIITPTSDVFTLLLVACPIWILYELGIAILKRQERKAGKSGLEEENGKGKEEASVETGGKGLLPPPEE